jgi:hypothetical protein
MRLIGLQRVIDDDDITTAASQLSTGRSCQTSTTEGRLEFVLSVLARTDFEGRKLDSAEPFRTAVEAKTPVPDPTKPS